MQRLLALSPSYLYFFIVLSFPSYIVIKSPSIALLSIPSSISVYVFSKEYCSIFISISFFPKKRTYICTHIRTHIQNKKKAIMYF